MPKNIKWSKVIIFVLLAMAAIIWILPLLWILSTSFKTETEAVAGGIHFIPKAFTLQTYKDILFNKDIAEQAPVLRWFWNSLYIAISNTALVLLVSSLSAFAFARLEFKGKKFLFPMLMSTMMIPNVINLVPLYKIMTIFKWIDKPWAMIVPSAGAVLSMFLIRQFMLGIPKDFDEAATIDGASTFRVYWSIIMPLSRPVLTVVGLFAFMGNWNDFLWPIIVTNDINNRTLPAGLKILQGYMTTQYAKLMAAAVLSTIPVFILFLFAQKYFRNGLSISAGVKG